MKEKIIPPEGSAKFGAIALIVSAVLFVFVVAIVVPMSGNFGLSRAIQNEQIREMVAHSNENDLFVNRTSPTPDAVIVLSARLDPWKDIHLICIDGSANRKAFLGSMKVEDFQERLIPNEPATQFNEVCEAQMSKFVEKEKSDG